MGLRHVAELEAGGIELQGFSLAGEETWIAAPQLNCAFDVGRCPREVLAVDHVFLSHGHMDHSAGIAYYFAQRLFLDNQPGNLYVPAGLEGPIRQLLRVWADIDGREPPGNIHVAKAGEDVALRRDLVMRPFEVNHPCRRPDGSVIRSLGYAAIEVRQKLKDEFAGLTQTQIVELKRQGTQLTRRLEAPLLCYCGDTAAGDFLALDWVRQARVLLVECTFFEPDHIRRARHGNHMHVQDLRRIISTLENEHIVLVHTSRRTLPAEARAVLQRELGADAGRISFLMDHRRRRDRAPRSKPPEEGAAGSSLP